MAGMDRRHFLIGSAALLALSACDRSRTASGSASASAASSAPPTASTPAPAGPAPSGPVVTILGDSITAGLGLPAAQALPARLQAALTEAGSTLRVRGAGISGDTLEAGLARLDFSVGDDTAICIVALGGNDLLRGTPVEQVRANLTAIVSRLKARHIRVVLAGVAAPSRASGPYGREFAAAFAEVARAQRVEAFVPNLLEGVGPELRQADGLHPNAQGVDRIVRRLALLLRVQPSR